MLLYFGYKIDRGGHVKAIGDNSQGLIDRWEIFFFKFHIDHRTDDLHHATGWLAVRTEICARVRHLSFNSSCESINAEKRQGSKARQDNTRRKAEQNMSWQWACDKFWVVSTLAVSGGPGTTEPSAVAPGQSQTVRSQVAEIEPAL